MKKILLPKINNFVLLLKVISKAIIWKNDKTNSWLNITKSHFQKIISVFKQLVLYKLIMLIKL